MTENEQKVYLELLKLGESTASPILKVTGLQNSVFYRTIHRLMEKGYVTYILKGKIKHFKSVDPKAFINDIKEKELEIKEIIPKLQELQKQAKAQATAQATAEVYIGLKGLVSMYYELIEDAKKGEEYYFFGPREDSAMNAMKEIYIPFRKYRKDKGLKVYGLNPKNIKKYIEQPSYVTERFTDLPLPANMAIFRDKIVIASWGDVPTGTLIHARDVAEQYKELFKELWKQSKKS